MNCVPAVRTPDSRSIQMRSRIEDWNRPEFRRCATGPYETGTLSLFAKPLCATYLAHFQLNCAEWFRGQSPNALVCEQVLEKAHPNATEKGVLQSLCEVAQQQSSLPIKGDLYSGSPFVPAVNNRTQIL